MARGNLFLGQARGKVGSVVFSRAFGEQITRTRPTSVSNPRTTAQNVQRAILATVAKEASLMTPIVDHSFANVAYGAESVRYFRKVNLGILRNRFNGVSENMNLSAKGANAVPNALKISEGNLPTFTAAYQNNSIVFYQGDALEGNAEVTVGAFRAAYPYLQGGDQITLVKWVKAGGSLENSDATFVLKVDRMVFAPDAFDDPLAEMIDDEGSINEDRLDMTKTTNADMLIAINGASGNGLGCTTNSDNTYAAALILSRKVNNVWQRSTQYLVITNIDDWVDIYSAVESYGNTASLAEATEYLNQADESTPAAGVNGAYANFAVLVDGTEIFNDSLDAGTSNSDTAAIPASSNFALKVTGFGTKDNRLVTCEISDPSNVLLVHGNDSARWSKNWKSLLAGAYKLTALFADGTRAEYTITLSQRT